MHAQEKTKVSPSTCFVNAFLLFPRFNNASNELSWCSFSFSRNFVHQSTDKCQYFVLCNRSCSHMVVEKMLNCLTCIWLSDCNASGSCTCFLPHGVLICHEVVQFQNVKTDNTVDAANVIIKGTSAIKKTRQNCSLVCTCEFNKLPWCTFDKMYTHVCSRIIDDKHFKKLNWIPFL